VESVSGFFVMITLWDIRQWIEEFTKENGLIVPQYRLISSLEKPEMFLDSK
jgi:hypothetical protein